MEAVTFLLPAFAACVLVAAIHVYLGYHVITRGVIFVDLSLAQVAALGAMVVAVYVHEPGELVTYAGSLTFALLGAALFALTGGRHRDERVPQEAIIGIVYAVAAALVVLAASKMSHGSEEIERMLVGNVLWVTWPVILRTAGIYAAIGALHFALRRPLLAISTDAKAAHASGLPVRLYDFVFYASFAVVITLSVPIAGVLLVFAFLVVPSVIGALTADGIARRLVVGWASALTASIAGLASSWKWDLPTGAAVVASFGVLLSLVALAKVRRWKV